MRTYGYAKHDLFLAAPPKGRVLFYASRRIFCHSSPPPPARSAQDQTGCIVEVFCPGLFKTVLSMVFLLC